MHSPVHQYQWQWKMRIIALILSLLSLGNPFCSHAAAPSMQTPHFRDVTILVPSCDRYSDVWPAFFTLLFRHWPSLTDGVNRDIPILLTSNQAVFSHPRVTTLPMGKDGGWSSQVLQALEHVKTSHVLILLEDYLLTTPVNEQRLTEAFTLLKKQDAAYVELGPEIYHMGGIPKGVWGGVEGTRQHEVPGKTAALPPLPEGVVYKKKYSDYRTSLQACLWGKSDLQWLLKPGETAWDFELIGTVRSQGSLKPFLGMLEPFPFQYKGAVLKGVLMPDAMAYAKEQGVEIIPTHLKVYKMPLKARLRQWWNQIGSK